MTVVEWTSGSRESLALAGANTALISGTSEHSALKPKSPEQRQIPAL